MKDWIEKSSLIECVDEFKFIIDSVITLNDLRSETESRSTRGENSQQFDLTNNADQLSAITSRVSHRVKTTLVERGRIDPQSTLIPRSYWTVLGYENTFHGVHWHNTSKSNRSAIATVTYISMSKNTANKPGCLFAMIDGSPIHTNCKLGDLIMFPANVYHGTYPQGPGLRQTLNIDFNIK